MPVSAAEAATVSDIAAAEHSLNKWRGLTTENLEKHGLNRKTNVIFNGDKYAFSLGSSNCALCRRSEYKHIAAGQPPRPGALEDLEDDPEYCQMCPIVKQTQKTCSEEYRNLWDYESSSAGVRPMIALLELTVAWCKKAEALRVENN